MMCDDSEMRQRLVHLRDRLTDLTRRNRSLRLLRLYNKWSFDLESLNHYGDLGADEAVKRVVDQRQTSLARLLSSERDELSAVRRLRALQRNLDEIEEERGMYSMYVGYPFLTGKLQDGTYIQSPVFLFPVRLRLTSAGGSGESAWAIDPRDEEPSVNRTLVLGVQNYNQMQIDDSIYDMANEFPRSDFLEHTRERLSKHGIVASVFDGEEILPVEQYLSTEIPDTPEGALSLRPFAVLGSFPHSTNPILGDYERLLEDGDLDLGLGGDLLEYMGGELPETDGEVAEINIDDCNEREAFFLTEVDNSQAEAIVASQQSDCIVVHGPPGTGKSQVIVNLVANALHKGQKLMVVCQKRAALDVVYDRLTGYELTDHIAVVHDALGDRRELYDKIGRLLTQEIVDDALLQAWDHNAVSDDVQLRMEGLQKIAKALIDSSRFGVTPFYLYSRIDPQADLIEVKDFVKNASLDSLESLGTEIELLGDLFERFETEEHPLVLRKSFKDVGVIQTRELADLVRDLTDELISFEKSYLDCLPDGWCPGTCRGKEDAASNLLEVFSKSEPVQAALSSVLETCGLDFSDVLPDVLQSVDDLSAHLANRQLDILIVDAVEGTDLETEEGVLSKYLAHNVLIGVWSRDWRDAKSKMQRLMDKRGVPFNRKSAEALMAQVQESLLVKRITDVCQGDLRVFDLPPAIQLQLAHLDPIHEALLYLQLIGDHAKVMGDVLPATGLTDFASEAWELAKEHLEAIRDSPTATEEVAQSFEPLRGYFQDKYVDHLVATLWNGERLSAVLASAATSIGDEFDEIKRVDALKADFTGRPEVSGLLAVLLDRFPPGKYDNLGLCWKRALEQSVYIYWLDHIESEVSDLAGVTDGTFSELQEKYGELLDEKRQHSMNALKSILYHRVKDARATPKKGQLQHQVEKRRGLWTIRRLVEEFRDYGLFDLIPCWLVTPEMVSSCFPDEKGTFDIVIFDEASQCPVENGLPSVYRAKRIVVAGDEKQLPPNRLFQVAADGAADGANGDSLLESESLLDLAKQCYPTHMLTWHYRSESEELINYSNHAFYSGRMHVAPNVESPATPPAIEWRQVTEGIWLDQRNEPEADAVCEFLASLMTEDGFLARGGTIGIITFNQPQQALILDKIDEMVQDDLHFGAAYREVMSRPLDERLFVKNIENVQGDERDTIVFSTAYGPGNDGRVRVQFGTLSNQGGENRLNVAITRARRKTYIFSSVNPDDLDVSSTRNEGPRYLKRYLQYAKAVSESNAVEVDRHLRELNGGPHAGSDHGLQLLFDSVFEEQVHQALTDRGLLVDSQVGASGYRIDLAVRHPKNEERFVLGIECDGASFHSAKSVRERDVYRQRYLESRGWKITRIWSRNWWRNASREVDRVIALVEELV